MPIRIRLHARTAHRRISNSYYLNFILGRPGRLPAPVAARAAARRLVGLEIPDFKAAEQPFFIITAII
jgi:hypothetical protein